MAHQTAERFMRALEEMERSGDVEPMVSLFAEDAETSNLAITEPLRGLDGARRFWRDYLAAFQRIRSRFTNVIDAGAAAVFEWASEGALAAGQPFTYRGVSIIEIEHDRVKRFRAYYDSAAFLPEGAKGARG